MSNDTMKFSSDEWVVLKDLDGEYYVEPSSAIDGGDPCGIYKGLTELFRYTNKEDAEAMAQELIKTNR